MSPSCHGFVRLSLPSSQSKNGPRARVMVADRYWDDVVRLLYDRDLIAPIVDDDIFKAHGRMVLNGHFGVEKPDKPLTPEGPALRLIMNFVPINTYLLEALGEVATLPRAGQCMTMYGEDQSSSFYLYALR
eukprot:1081393-Amphidinium_carterae.1